MVRALALLVCLLAPPAHAQGIGAAIHQARWADADALAAAMPDPVARKLVLFSRLLAPGGGNASEIAAFIAANPGWPSQDALAHRLQQAIATVPDDQVVQPLCPVAREAPALLRCAQAGGVHAADAARLAWLTGITDPAGEAAFIHQWGGVLTSADQWQRFDRLAWTDHGAVDGPAWRQIARLDLPQRRVAEARLALKRDDPSARALVAALPPGPRESALLLDLASWLRRARLEDQAQALWLGPGQAAEAAAPPDRRAAFWDERNRLARARLRAGDDAGAYALADQAQATGEAAADAAFLAGFIALRRLGDVNAAAGHFRTLAGLSKAAITQARALYWLGRTGAAAHDKPAARAAYAAAAAWPTTFYGQLAARALGEDDQRLAARIRRAQDPAWTPAQALAFAGTEAARAAALLYAWGEPAQARRFLLDAAERASEDPVRAMAARVAAEYGMPDLAVTIARRAGRAGCMLPQSGWPAPIDPPATVEPALALGLIRQESSFDAAAASPAGARGLMQLMPATAAAVARRLGERPPDGVLDPAVNMRLGTAYLASLLDGYGGVVPYALAAYNAGAGRVAEWRLTNGEPAAGGDPAAGGTDMIDWIELIPFGETRNYVQRVIENVVLYRARAGGVLPHPLARFLG